MSTAALAREVQKLRARRPRRTPLVASPIALAHQAGLVLDDWQHDYLSSPANRRILCATRQGGKSTLAAIDALYDALVVPNSLVLVIAPSERQSAETFRKVAELYGALGMSVPSESERKLGLELLNGSRVEALPGGSERTIRGFSAPRRVIADEASRVTEEIFTGAVLPMLATSGGGLDLISTPNGRQGFFFRTWEEGEGWARWEVPATKIPRISPEFIEEQRSLMGERWIRQEFFCEFLETDDQVFGEDLIEAATGHEVSYTGGFDWCATG